MFALSSSTRGDLKRETLSPLLQDELLRQLEGQADELKGAVSVVV